MSQDYFALDGHLALVTGAGTGLGAHFSKVLAQAGARVVLAARRENKLAETAERIRDAGGEAHCLPVDVSDAASVTALFERCTAEIGVPGIVVNNAGISRDALLIEASEDDWDGVIDTNLKGVHLVAAEAARRLAAAGQPGSIINVASVLGIGVEKTLGAYMAAKAGVIQLTRAQALEWAKFRIRANALAPGYFLTDINRDFFATQAGTAMVKRIPQRRIGEYDDLTGPLLLLASDASRYMTGSTLVVDGGHLLQQL
ncbi:MAG: SDR family oxidoreductase [Gammaproteobacteria bacterium]|nr:SDR family oxidoreductase [Gammaproteobacteria bacterium]